jgi:hypothetical protein
MPTNDRSTPVLSLAIKLAPLCDGEAQAINIASQLVALRDSGTSEDGASKVLSRELHVSLADAKALTAHAFAGSSAPPASELPTVRLSAVGIARALVARGTPHDVAAATADRLMSRLASARPAPTDDGLPTVTLDTRALASVIGLEAVAKLVNRQYRAGRGSR